MSLQEWAVAIGLLTPLVLGILAFIEKFFHKKADRDEDEPEMVQGMTITPVDYGAELIKELRKERTDAEKERDDALKKAEQLQHELNIYKQIGKP